MRQEATCEARLSGAPLNEERDVVIDQSIDGAFRQE